MQSSTIMQRNPKVAADKTIVDDASVTEHLEMDWAETIRNLVTLAKTATSEFEPDKAVEYVRSAEQIWKTKGLPEFSFELRFDVHREGAKALALLGRLDKAISEYQKILKLCCHTEHLPIKSDTCAQIGQRICKQGDYDRALGYLQRALGTYRRLDDKSGICRALRNLGVVYVELGEFEEAVSTLEEATEIAETIGERVLQADLINNLGAVLNMRGERQKALEYYQRSLDMYTSENEIRKTAYTINNIAITYKETGQTNLAFEHFKRSFEIAKKIGDAALVLIVQINLADIYLEIGDLMLAEEHCRQVSACLLESQSKNGHLVEVRKIEGRIASKLGDFEQAEILFNHALMVSEEIGAQYFAAEVIMERGILYHSMGRNFDALKDLESSYLTYSNLRAIGKREEAEKVIASIEELYLNIFDSMAREVDQKDQYTKGHSDRVASLSLLLAREIGIQGNGLKSIVAGALLHDIGKLKIDDSVLKKPGRLTPGEFDQIKRHPQAGIELLEGKEFPWDVRPVILYHHERIDGGGYPEGLSGEEIPLSARIVCVADVFDALTSDRVYREAYDPSRSLEIMQSEVCRTFDPVLLERFKHLIEEGLADLVINSRTRKDEMYSIWSRCMDADPAEQVEDEGNHDHKLHPVCQSP